MQGCVELGLRLIGLHVCLRQIPVLDLISRARGGRGRDLAGKTLE